MIIGIIGCRSRDTEHDLKLVEDAFVKFCRDLEEGTNHIDGVDSIVSGGCPKGGDRFAEVIAKKYRIPITIHRPDWERFGRSAGFKRNIYIAEDADVLIACVTKERTGGTEHTISLFKKHNPQGEVILV